MYPSNICPALMPFKAILVFPNQVHYNTKSSGNDCSSSSSSRCINNVRNTTIDASDDWTNEKNKYLLKSNCNTISNVRWYSVDTTSQSRRRAQQSHPSIRFEEPEAREGHVSCIIGNFLVLTGGYTDDEDIYVKHLNHFEDGTTWMRISLEQQQGQQNPRLVKEWVYGATLTPYSNTSAIMFGGFKSGGYSNETAQVAVLHLEETSSSSPTSNMYTGEIRARWEVMECNVSHDDGGSTLPTVSGDHPTNESFLQIVGRAYHTATLLFDRYLLIVGGMQSRGSVLNPILLDCQNWTWYLNGITTRTTSTSIADTSRPDFPSGRHGCSMIADMESNRNRLLLFGGGSGEDLLRSGTDNTEVWELKLNDCKCASDVISSVPWTWNILHLDQTGSSLDDSLDDNDGHGNDNSSNSDVAPNVNTLSSIEQLNLGRCHVNYRVGRDTAILAFGSGRPTTNTILCYNLNDDSFYRPSVHPSYIPCGRFTCASTFIESKGIILFHGGFSTQPNSDTLSDTILLDLAPALTSQYGVDGRIWLPIDYRAQCHPVTSDSLNPTRRISIFGDSTSTAFSFYCSQMMGKSPVQQREISSHLLTVMDESQQAETIRVIVRLFATGQLVVGEDGSILDLT